MNVLLDSRKIFHGGIGVYIQNLIAGLSKSKQVNLKLLISNDEADKIKDTFSWANDAELYTTDIKILSVKDFFSLNRVIDQIDFDLYHSPFINLPITLKRKAIMTIHDLIQISHPEKAHYPYSARTIISQNLKKAHQVITVSEASAAKIRMTFAKIDLDNKLEVIPNSLPAEFVNQEVDETSLQSKTLVGIFSSLKPHKGLADLITAFEAVKKSIPDVKLQLIGHNLKEQLAESEYNSLLEDNQVEIYSDCSNIEIAEKLCKARGLVMASKVEGFCLPVLLAHACGCPVATYPEPAIQELCSQYDSIAKNFSETAYKMAILELFHRSPMTKEEKTFMIAHANEYSEERFINEHIRIYQNCHSS